MDIDVPGNDRGLLARTSTVEAVAAFLRAQISAGDFEPGAKLVDKTIADSLGVSRNTVREAYQLLSHERLLVQKLNRGMFVRVLDIADVIDIYRLRTHVECSVVRAVTAPPPPLDRIAAAVDEGALALAEQDWRALGTANIGFHQELVALAGSPRLDELMRGVLAELRLVFHVMDNPRWFHEPYLARNREILVALTDGDGTAAERLLAKYLGDAEQQLVEVYAARRSAR